MRPETPASSNASTLAASHPLLPYIVQPLGTMNRSVEREVISITCISPPGVSRNGTAATCRMGRPFFALWIIFLLFMQLRPASIQKR